MDIGGTHVRLAIMKDEQLITPVKKFQFKHDIDAKTEINRNICMPIVELLNKLSIKVEDVVSIGVALAALFNRKNGEIVTWPNHRKWDKFPIKSYLEEQLKISVILEDDANAAALGEHSNGAGKGYKDFAYITVSTGVGCGLILNNTLYTGSDGWAGELGHIQIPDCYTKCNCGAVGCLQSIASGRALYERFRREAQLFHKEYLHITKLEEVADRAKQGDETAIRLFEECGYYISNAVTNIVMLLGLPLVVLGGGVINAGESVVKHIDSGVNKHLKHFNRSVEIRIAQLGDESGVMGALHLASIS